MPMSTMPAGMAHLTRHSSSRWPSCFRSAWPSPAWSGERPRLSAVLLGICISFRRSLLGAHQCRARDRAPGESRRSAPGKRGKHGPGLRSRVADALGGRCHRHGRSDSEAAKKDCLKTARLYSRLRKRLHRMSFRRADCAGRDAARLVLLTTARPTWHRGLWMWDLIMAGLKVVGSRGRFLGDEAFAGARIEVRP